MKTNRFFLKFSSKRNQKAAAAKASGLRKSSALAGSIAMLAASAMTLTTAPVANAAQLYWDVNGATAGFGTITGGWNAANFWTLSGTGTSATFQAPTAADDLNIIGGTLGTMTLTGTAVASSISFGNATQALGVAVTLSGGTSLTLGGGGSLDGIFSRNTAATIVSTTVVLASSANYTNDSTGLLTIGATGSTTAGAKVLTIGSSSSGGITLNGAITNATGTIGLVVNNTGSGQTTLSSTNNTFTGGVTIQAGTLNANNGVANATSAVIAAANAINLGHTSGASNATLSFGGNFNNTQGGNVTVVAGSSGVLRIQNSSNNTKILSGTVTINNTGGVTLGTTGTGALQFNGAMIGSNPITISSTGTGPVILNFANTGYTAANTFVNAGTVRLAGSAAVLGNTSTIQLGDTAGTAAATVQMNNNLTILNPITVRFGSSGVKTLSVNGNPTATWAGVITLNDNLTFSNGGTGSMTISGTSNTLNGNILTVSVGGTGNANLNGAFAGTGSMVTAGAGSGIAVFNGQHTFSGGVTLSAGTNVSPTVDSTPTVGALTSGPFGTGIVTMNGATIRAGTTTGDRIIGNAISLNANTTFNSVANENSINWTGPVTLNADRILTVNTGTNVASKAITFSGDIGGGAFGITQNGTGRLVLAGTANTYTGTTAVTSGILQVTGNLDAASSLSVAPSSAAGAVLALTSGAANPISITSVALGNATGPSIIGLDLGTSSDSIAASAASTANGVINFNINAIAGFGAGPYSLVSALSGLTATAPTYGINSAPGGFSYSFTNTDALIQLNVAAAAAPTLYWKGNFDNSWSSISAGLLTNFTTDGAGVTQSASSPSAGTSVIFSDSTATGPTITTALNQNYTINDLQFIAAPGGVTAVNIAGGTTPALAPGVLTLAPSLSTAGISVAANAGTVTISAPVVLGAAQTWTVDGTGGARLALSGGITGANTLVLAGSNGGTVTFAGASSANSYSGTTTINAGATLQGGATNALPLNSAVTVTGTLSTGAFAGTVGSITGAGTVQNGSTTNAVLSIGNDGTGTLASPIGFAGLIQNGSSGTLGITKVGAGVQALTGGANTYTGPTAVNGGTLIATGGSIGATSAVSMTGGTLQITTPTTLVSTNTVNLAAAGTLDLFGNSVTTGVVTSVATSFITNSGTGTGTDTLTISPAQATAVSSLITDGGGTRKVQLVINNNNTSTQVTSNSANTYSGGLILAHNAAGGTRLSVGTVVGTPWGSGPISIGQTATDKAGIFFATANQTIANDIIFNTALGSDRVGIRSDVLGTTLSGKITANLAPATFTSNSGTGGSFFLTGQVTGAFGLVLDITSLGSITTNFNGTLNNAGTPNDYAGDTVINFNPASGKSATLHLGAANQLPNGTGTGNVLISSNGTGVGTLNLAGFSETINGLNGNGVVNGTVGTPTLTIGDNDATAAFSGAITGASLTVTKIGIGTQTFSGTGNTFGGPLNVNGGFVAFATSPATNGPLGNSPVVNLNGGGLSYTAVATSANLNRPIAIGAGTGTLNVVDAPSVLTISGASSTGGDLVKTGLGGVIINGTTAMGGGSVTVSDGKLTAGFGVGGVNNVNVGATGNLSFQNGTAEVLTLTGGITLTAGSRLGFDLAASGGPGVSDQLVSSVAAATGAGVITLDFMNLAGFGSGTYNLISALSGLTSTGATYVLGSGISGFKLVPNATDTLVSLTVTPFIPAYWRGGQNASWSTLGAGAANWTTDAAGTIDALAVPGSLDTVVFSTPLTPFTSGTVIDTTLDAAFVIDSLQFNNQSVGTVTAVSINSGTGGAASTLTISPTSTVDGIEVQNNAGTITIGAPVIAGTSQTWSVTGTGNELVVSGNTTFTGPVRKTGAGALTLSGTTNTGTGGVTLDGGTLNIGSSTALGAGTFAIGALTTIDAVGGAQTLTANNAQTWKGPFTFTGSNALNLGAGAVTMTQNVAVTTTASTLTIGGGIGESGGARTLTKAGAGELILNGNNNYTGLTSVTAGTLTLAGNNSSASGGVTLTAGQLNINNDNALGSGRLTLSGGTFDSTNAARAVAGSPVQTWSSGATTIFAGTNTVDLGAGAVDLGIDSSAGTFTLTNNSAAVGTSLTVGGTISAIAGGAPGAKTLTLNGVGTTLLSGNLSAGAATGLDVTNGITSAGSLKLSGTSTIRTLRITQTGGVVDLTGGNLSVSNLGAVVVNSTNNATLNAGTITLTSGISGTATASQNYADFGASAGLLTVNSILAGSSGIGVDFLGAGTVLLTGANTFTGPAGIYSTVRVTSIGDAGTDGNLGNGSTLGTNAGNIQLGSGGTGGTLVYEGTGENTNKTLSIGTGTATNTIDMSGTGTLRFSATSNIAGTTTGIKTLNLQGSTAGIGQLDQNIVNTTNGGAVISVTKNGTGTWTLNGSANTYTGNTTVNGGTLNITGSINGNNASSNLVYGNTAGNTIVNVSGTVSNYKNFTGANAVGSIAVMNQTGGSTSTLGTNGGDTQWVAKTGYGALNITGGTFNTGRFDLVANGGTNGVGTVYVGGTGIFNNNVGDWLILARGGTNTIAELNVGPGGSVVRGPATTALLGITMDGIDTRGTLNIAGGTVDSSTRAITFGFGASATFTGNKGFVNLAGGTLKIGAAVTQTNTAGSTDAYFNFAGGKLESNATLANFIPATSIAGHTITSTIFGSITNNNNANAAFNTQIGVTSNFIGGLTVDTNTFATTFANAFLAASGVGVTQADIGDVSLLAGNSGYIGAPTVTFSSPAGGTVPASGYAVIDPITGTVTGIIITNPGVYAASETPTITLSGGGGTIAAFATGALATANVSGGLTKIGANTLTLSGANTYTGDTTISVGTLQLGAGGAVGTLSPLSNIVDNSNFTINRSGTVTQGTDFGTISTTGTGSFTQAGTGTTIFTANNTYNGGTTISAGTLQLGNASTTGNLGTGAVANAGILRFNRTNAYILDVSNIVTGAGAVTLAGTGSVASAVDGQFNTTGALNIGGSVGDTTLIGDLDLTNGSSTFGALNVLTNNAGNTITLPTGKTLTINGNVVVGYATPVALNSVAKLTIGGGGTLNVATAAGGLFAVGASTLPNGTASLNSVLDLTGLASVTIDVTATGTVRVSQVSPSNTAGNQSSLLLPTPVVALNTPVTTITAGTLAIGTSSGNGGVGQTNAVTFGTGLTTLNVNTINVGTGSRDVGQITFAPGNGTLQVRAADGIGRTAFNVANNTANTGVGGNNLVNLSGHSSDLLISTLTIGGQNRNVNRTDTFTFDTGILDATGVVVGTNTGATSGTVNATWTSNLNLGGGATTIGASGLDVGFGQTAVTGTDVINGNVNISGGTVGIANNAGFGAAVRLGHNTIATGLTANGLLNITGGVVTVSGNIIKGVTTGAGSATVTLNGGTLDMTNNSIGGVAPLTVALNAQSGTLTNLAELNNGADLTKTTAGTLLLQGANNAYTGQTIIAAGTVQADVVDAVATNSQSLGRNTDVTLGAVGVSSGTLSYTGVGAGTLAKNVNVVGNGTDTIANNGGGALTLAGTLTKNGTTLTLNAVTNGINVTGNIVGAAGSSDLIIAGGTTTVSSTGNTYNGPTTVNTGATLAVTGSISGTTGITTNGTLLLNSSTNASNIIGATGFTGVATTQTTAGSASTVNYTGTNGSTLSVSNVVAAGVSNSFGTLTLSGNSFLDFASGNTNNNFFFTGLGGTTLADLIAGGANTLTINNWNIGAQVFGSGVDNGNFGDNQSRLLFTSDPGFGAGIIAGINFTGFGAGAQQIAYGSMYEIVPVPEPATTALIGSVALCALIGYRERRRFTGMRRPVGKK